MDLNSEKEEKYFYILPSAYKLSMDKSSSHALFGIITVLFLLCIPLTTSMDQSVPTASSTGIEKGSIDKALASKDDSVFLNFNFQLMDDRYFLWALPQAPSSSTGYPVLFLFHGAAQYPFAWFIGLNSWSKAQTSFTNIALNNGFLVIAPSSQRPIQPGPRAWDIFTKDISESEDLQFVSRMLDWLKSINTPIDWDRIYCTGFSSGAFMTSHIAQYFGDRFAGVIVHSGANAESITLSDRGPVFDCTSPYEFPKNHSSTLIVHGGSDGFVPSECGIHYYDELLRCGFDATLLFDSDGGHIWLSEYNEEIISWLKRDIT